MTRAVPAGAENHVFLLGDAVEDVEDPVQPAGLALGFDVWADIGVVVLGGFGDVTEALSCVFGDVFGCARVDEVEF